ncbi:SDR family NAD(P)-dependent oxidoreductase [Amycolatopsis rhizosphaerae]|uniref:SDR family NAD(P)-dependent oxidoreductase n=1 Tax=Amycolatopsis rhizosphaerae TaxID=2053003 RepID=A0A558DIN8_9PSEU|nr:SDR family NAD(P)-dependent oxidoreductase [Amycolatopsis rhizosphaerae]TVT60853.1 SDR family NAD(P)-dependent oxidoreductase [Amycolatopsis rhizosphaerae]
MPVATIIGAGPGIGQAVARRFAREGFSIMLVARSKTTVEGAAARLTGVPTLALTADATNETALRTALDVANGRFGLPDVVVYNAARVKAHSLEGTSLRDHLDAWAVNVGGAIVTAAHLAPAMAGRGNGTFLVTGGMPEPKPEYSSLSLGKAGVRTLVALIDQRYGAAGVHAASVTIGGPVAPGTAFDPRDIAEHYWRLHTQPHGRWDHEVVHTEEIGRAMRAAAE